MLKMYKLDLKTRECDKTIASFSLGMDSNQGITTNLMLVTMSFWMTCKV